MLDYWNSLPLLPRIQWIRRIVPIGIVLVVITYQLFIALRIEDAFGHFMHYSLEILFYSLAGPLVTWSTLKWIETKINEKENLEEQVLVQSEQLAKLTNISPDAIILLGHEHRIVTWNQGAENIFEYSKSEAQGKLLSQLLGTSIEFNKILDAPVYLQNLELIVRTKSKNSTKINISAATIQTTKSPEKSHLLIIRDVSARKEREEILEEERQRISRDLHDHVAQTLYFIALKSDLLISTTMDPERKTDLTQIAQNTRKALSEVRRTIFSLTSLEWKDDQFIDGLIKFIHQFSDEAGWEVKTDLDVTLDIPPMLQAVIFRVVQESLNNVAKHANARHVEVDLALNPKSNKIELSIRDNGVGFNPDDTNKEGFGITQMRSRVENIKGKLDILTAPEMGTTIQARF